MAATPPGPAPAAAPTSGQALIWAQGLACGGMVALAPAASLLVALLLAPGLLALALDRGPGRPIARAMLLCGAAPCVAPIMRVWDKGGGEAALALVTDPASLCGAWGAAAAGWLALTLLPVGVKLILDARSLSQAARLRAERDRLIRDWGLEEGGQADQ